MKGFVVFLYAKVLKKLRGSAIRNCVIDESSVVESGCTLYNTKMGKHSFCGYNCEIANADIGSFCSIANGVVIGGGMHPIDWVSTSPVFYSGRDSVKAKFSEHERELPKRVTIGHDVWLGQNVLIKQGVNIGTGAIVGMGSVVTKDVAPYAIVAGCPAKFIKNRFDEELCEELLSSEWWNLENSILLQHGQLIKDPKSFVELINK
jgi:acetyltransferase-like isoleucine patch superfamily enzyme